MSGFACWKFPSSDRGSERFHSIVQQKDDLALKLIRAGWDKALVIAHCPNSRIANILEMSFFAKLVAGVCSTNQYCAGLDWTRFVTSLASLRYWDFDVHLAAIAWLWKMSAVLLFAFAAFDDWAIPFIFCIIDDELMSVFGVTHGKGLRWVHDLPGPWASGSVRFISGRAHGCEGGI